MSVLWSENGQEWERKKVPLNRGALLRWFLLCFGVTWLLLWLMVSR